MTTKIDEKIVGWEVVKEGELEEMQIVPYERPYKLYGVTYKLKPPTMEAALYVTVNHIMMPDGRLRPLEIFLNTKDVSHTQWMMAVARLLSALFRQPLPFEFALQELKEVVDGNAAYFIPGGGGKCGGIVSHLGILLEAHCQEIGAISSKQEELTEQTKQELNDKKEKAEKAGVPKRKCPKCQAESLVMLDGCETCVSCGHSKCG